MFAGQVLTRSRHVLQGAAHPRIAPGGILLGHTHDEPPDLHEYASTTASPFCVRPFARDELPMPPQNRVGRDDRGDLTQPATANRCPRMPSRRRSSSLSRRRRPRSCPRRMRFSSIRYARDSCCRRSSPAAATTTRRENTSTTAGKFIASTEIQAPEAGGLSYGTLRGHVYCRAPPGGLLRYFHRAA
jgi:hypothetical protein